MRLEEGAVAAIEDVYFRVSEFGVVVLVDGAVSLTDELGPVIVSTTITQYACSSFELTLWVHDVLNIRNGR